MNIARRIPLVFLVAISFGWSAHGKQVETRSEHSGRYNVPAKGPIPAGRRRPVAQELHVCRFVDHSVLELEILKS